MSTIALILRVFVDIVSPGKGLVTCGDYFSGTIVRDRERKSGYLVETEAGDSIGRAKSYHEGTIRLANHYGYAKYALIVEIEDESRY